MRDALAVRVAQHARVSDQVVRQHHQIHRGGWRGAGCCARCALPSSAALRRAGPTAGCDRAPGWTPRNPRSRAWRCSSPSGVGDRMDRSSVANSVEARPPGGRTSTARRGSQPTWTAPSGRSSTGNAGSSAYKGVAGGISPDSARRRPQARSVIHRTAVGVRPYASTGHVARREQQSEFGVDHLEVAHTLCARPKGRGSS
jgi:hypothetical protein